MSLSRVALARFAQSVLGWMALIAVCVVGGCATAHAKFVFAHYMVCCGLHANPSVEQLADEIQLAQHYGVDGFVLNCGAWNREPRYEIVSEKLFRAAEKLNTGFVLFFSADPSTGLSAEEAVSMYVAFKDRPNYFKYGGRGVLTTFHGQRQWVEQIQSQLSDLQASVFFAPNVSTLRDFALPGREIETPGVATAEKILDEDRDVDGHSYFGAGGTYLDIAASTLSLGAAARKRNKLFMAPVTPYYRGHGTNNRVFESLGFTGMAAEWEAAIQSGAEWVQIVTWNDWSEDTYVEPFVDMQKVEFTGRWPDALAHDGFLLASGYYIKWFKSGVEPVSYPPLFCVFFRPARRPGDETEKPRGFDKLQDRLFVFSARSGYADIVFSDGASKFSLALSPGAHNYDLPAEFEAGVLRMRVGGVEMSRSVPAPPDMAPGSVNYFSACFEF